MSMGPRKLTLRRTLDATVGEVFAAFLFPDALKHWWAPEGYAVLHAEVDARVGGRYSLEMRALGDSHIVTIHGVYREIDPPTRLVFTHTFEQHSSDDPFTAVGLTGHYTLVTIQLRPRGDVTELVLVQEEIPSAGAEGVLSAGWDGILDKLAGYVGRASGVDAC
jgi:uncharacterized protein YndB with AHSA1/START domain